MMSWREVRVDAEPAIQLLTEYFGSRAADFPPELGAYRTTFPTQEQFVPPRGLFLVLVEDDGTEPSGPEPAGAVLGCGGIRRIEPADDGGVRFEVKHLYLRPAARGRGLGRATLAELEARARGFGADELVLDTNASLTAAAGLYRSTGYEGIPPYNDNPNATNWYRKRLRGIEPLGA
jgi:ribosomal protein S18 acetylase RimI-like enzyme